MDMTLTKLSTKGLVLMIGINLKLPSDFRDLTQNTYTNVNTYFLYKGFWLIK